jgi:hypothetical protein
MLITHAGERHECPERAPQGFHPDWDPERSSSRLGKSHADQVLVVSFEHLSCSGSKIFIENLSSVASSMFGLLQEQQSRNSLQRLAEALVPRTPVPPRLIREAAMLVKARKAVLESGDWLSAAELAQLAQLTHQSERSAEQMEEERTNLRNSPQRC